MGQQWGGQETKSRGPGAHLRAASHGSALCLGLTPGWGGAWGEERGEEEETAVYSYLGDIFSLVFLMVSCQHKIHQTAS